MKCYFCAILNQMCKNRMEQEHQFIDYIEQSIIKNWDKDALTDYKGITLQYKDVARKIAKFHIVLESAGIQPGDKIAVCGRNSAHWGVTFLATITYGAVIVPILHEFKADNIHNIVNHSEAKLLFVGDQAWENLNEDAMPLLEGIASLTDFTALVSRNEKLTYAFEHRNAIYGQRYPKNFRPEHICYRKDRPEELAIINYTSGTTGYSKGVMLPYRSLWSNTQFAADNLPFIHAGDNIVCILPMAHMYGLAFEVLNSVNKGCHIHFITRMPSPQVIGKAFATCRPRLILAVPIIIEKIVRTRIFPIIEKPLMKVLLNLPVINTIIRKKIANQLNEAFGGNFEEIVIGGAPLNKEVEQFLRSIRFRYTVGYGMTECGPLVAYAQWDIFKPTSVGKIVDRMEVRIDSPDPQHKVGEILVRGTNNMLGYYKNPQITAAVMMPDGWMRTGDLGTIDADGFLYIRGRSKTMLLGPNGQNIYPEEIEAKLNNMPLVVESLIISDNKKLTALIYPDWDQIKKSGLTTKALNEQMAQNLKQLNRSIPGYCKVALYELREQEFEKTPKKSIKRFLYQPEL